MATRRGFLGVMAGACAAVWSTMLGTRSRLIAESKRPEWDDESVRSRLWRVVEPVIEKRVRGTPKYRTCWTMARAASSHTSYCVFIDLVPKVAGDDHWMTCTAYDISDLVATDFDPTLIRKRLNAAIDDLWQKTGLFAVDEITVPNDGLYDHLQQTGIHYRLSTLSPDSERNTPMYSYPRQKVMKRGK